MTTDDVNLWTLLGLPEDTADIPVPEDVWEAALATAVDPSTTPVDPSIIPDVDLSSGSDSIETEPGLSDAIELDHDGGADSHEYGGHDIGDHHDPTHGNDW